MDGVLGVAKQIPSWVGQTWPVIGPIITLLIGSYVANKQASEREDREDRRRRDQSIRDREIADLAALQEAVLGMNMGTWLAAGNLARVGFLEGNNPTDIAEEERVHLVPDISNEPWHIEWRKACSAVVIAASRTHNAKLKTALLELSDIAENVFSDRDLAKVQERGRLLNLHVGKVMNITGALYREFDRSPIDVEKPWYRMGKGSNPQLGEKIDTKHPGLSVAAKPGVRDREGSEEG